MPINTDLNIAPYFDDFDQEKQFYRVLFKPGYAVQARELTQLQSTLQNQIETFGDNIFQEGSIVKGCNFTNINGLEYVKLKNANGFFPTQYISKTVTEVINGIDTEVDIVYTVEGDISGLKAEIIQASDGFETRPPDLNTFYINYLTTNETTGTKQFLAGETLTINKYRYIDEGLDSSTLNVQQINVTNQANHAGKSFGIQASPGVVFQKGSFLFTEAQTLIVEKYSNAPDNKSVGYEVTETLVSALQDSSLYDNANGSKNENAPGADRLKMSPVLVVKDTAEADADADFFTLIRYKDGNAVQLRDVSQYNAIGNEMARRTYEESGNYLVEKFATRTEKRDGVTKVIVNPGVAYVKGYRVENTGEQAFEVENIANTVTQQNQPVSVEYGSYIDVTGITGTVDLGFNEADLEEGGTVIGKTYIRNITQDKIYLFGTRITTSGKTLADVDQIDSTSGVITVDTSSAVKQPAKSVMVFDTGHFSVKGTTDITVPIRDTITNATITSNQITLTNGGGIYDYNCNNDDVVVVDSTNTNRSITSAVSQSNNSELLITVGGAASGTGVTVYVNRRIQLTTPYNKSYVKPYIKVAYSSSTTKYSLGFPDVVKIISIEDSSGTDYTNSFRLHTNQKDSYYDISYMEYIAGRPEPAGTLTIKLGVFQLNPSSGDYFFTINSYPIDDDSETLPDDKIRSYDLAVYTASNGSNYNLRESVDFRPHCDPDSNADYSATSAGGAPTISAAADGTAPTFSRSDYIIPANGESLNMDIETYNSRIDMLTIDSFGEIALVKGNESQHPAPPKTSNDKMIISEVFVPGRPALSAFEADRQKKPEYAIRTRSTGIYRKTMEQIDELYQKVDRLEYYVTLNMLEKSIQDINVLDENGLSRFKNGYLAEPFNNLSFANMEDPMFNAAVPFDRKVMTPPVVSFPLDLKYKSSSSATIFPTTTIAESGSLSRNAHVTLLNQPYATNFRNCVSNFYDYRGVGAISPMHDFGVDTVANPVPNTLDITGMFQDFADSIQEFLPITGSRVISQEITSSRSMRSRDAGFNRGGLVRLRTANQVVETTGIMVNESNAVGDLVSNVEFNPFIRSRELKIYMAGLRPNTRHYFFFDETNVDAHVTPGTLVDAARDVEKAGVKGAAVETDDNGVLRAVFDIPAETFYVGERKLEISDVDQYGSIESSGISGGVISYNAYNMAIESTNIRVPEISVGTTRVTQRNVQLRPQFYDPLAQTFFIKDGMGQGSDTVMISKVDLYFKRKSETNGCVVEVREVINGYPGPRIIPFSQVHLTPNDVSVSKDASVATTVDFEAPIRLDVETEYCVVIRPDANDPGYLVFVSKIGEPDLTPGDTQGQTVVQDWGDGVLFTSTNNKAWKSYQDEDLKFTLYRHDYNAGSGSITLTNNDHEFFTLSDWTGAFTSGEFVYAQKALSGSTTTSVSISSGSTTVTGTALDDTYAVGDYIKIDDASSNPTREDIFQIVSIESATSMTVNKAASFAGIYGNPVVAGRVVYHNFRRPEKLYIEASNATTDKPFAATDTIVGLTSGSEGTIGTIDDINLSYVQPTISKSNDSGSTTTLRGRFVDTNNVNNYYEMPMQFGQANYFNEKGVVVYSKSNNLNGTKPFEITIDMTSSNSTSSPLIDIETSQLMANQYRIEDNDTGSATYISRQIMLADDLDAEDLNLFVTGYRPQGTTIKAYIRPQHVYDNAAFNTVDWIELELVDGARAFSSSLNPFDYREFKFAVSDDDKDGDGVLEYTSSAGDFKGFRKFAIRIDLLAPNIHEVPTVSDFRAIALT